MHPTHRSAIAAILGLAVVVGLLGLSRSLDLGATAAKSDQPAAATLAARSHRLDRVQAALRTALAQRPPSLPPVPTYPAPAAAPPAGPAVRRVAYVRPPPRVVTVHRRGDGEGEDHAGASEHEDD